MNVDRFDKGEPVSKDIPAKLIVSEPETLRYRKPRLFQLGSFGKVQYAGSGRYTDYQGSWTFWL